MAGRLSSRSSGRLSSSTRGRLSGGAFDLKTAPGLAQYARSVGLKKEADRILDKKPKLSFLQRLAAGLGAFNTANAIDVGLKKGLGAGALQYGKDVAGGLGAAVTGTDYVRERKLYRDIAKEAGVDSKIAQFGLGFAGDILLDPTTYFGGAIARGLVKGTTFAAAKGLTGVGRIAPKTEAGLRLAAEGIREAFGRAFVVGFGTKKGALGEVLTFLSKRDKAKLGLAASNLERLGTGVLSPAQQEELVVKLVAGKRAEFVAREVAGQTGALGPNAAQIARRAAASKNPIVQRVIEAQNRRSGKFASQLGIENPYEVYFPFIKKEKLARFVKEVDNKGIRVGSEAYRKQFKNLLNDEALELDPVKAFFNVEARQVSDKMTRNFLASFVKKYGQAFGSADEATANGYRVIREKGLFGKELGYVPEAEFRLISNLITPEFQSINMIAKATGFDALTNLFKRSVTGLFAPFHVRNFVSGVVQNFEVLGPAALNPKAIASGQKMAYTIAKGAKAPQGVIKVAGKEVSLSKIYKAFDDRFAGDTFYNNDFLEAIETGAIKRSQKLFSKASLKETAKTAGLGAEAIPFRVGRAVGQYIEHQQKATAYLVALSKGKTIDEALEIATMAGFDYRALTAFESQIMRRLIPFYSFTRKNIELQLRVLGTNPQRINQIIAFFNNVGDPIPFDEKQSLPDYIKRALGVKLADQPDGLKTYVSQFGTPVEQFAGLFQSNPILLALSMTNPLLKTPTEIGIGKDSFRQQDLKDVYNAKEYSNAPKVVKDLLGIKEVTKPVLRKLPDGSLVKVGTRQEYVADPVRLLIARSLFTSRGVTYLDTIFNGDVEGFAKFLKVTTGVKPQTVDIEMFKSLKERDQRRALEDLLQKTGYISIYTNPYIPKEQ